jgi:heterodisulfide reductase subunit B
MARESGAHAIVVACPLCQSNLDMRQPDIEKKSGITYRIPVLYITQLMALAFGHPLKDLKPAKHIVPIEPALAHIGEEIESPQKTPKSKKAVEAESEVE